MIRVTRRYRFAASHRLHAPQLDDAANRRLYGKCNNPYGHGHNYVLEVSARGRVDPLSGAAVDVALLDALVRDEVLGPFDQHDLNTGIEAFRHSVPTSENLGREVFRRLSREWPRVFPGPWPQLAAVRIAETPRNFFEISAHEHESE